MKAIAIGFFDLPPPGVPRWQGGAVPAGCVFWDKAMRGQTFYTLPADHYNCAVGSHTHRIPLPPERAHELQDTIAFMARSSYVATEEVPGIPTLAMTPGVVAYGPVEDAGFKVDLQVLDWATVVQRRSKPELWDVFTTAITFQPDPALTSNLQCDWPGWWCHEEKERLVAELLRESDPRRRRAVIERIQAVFYEDVGRIKMGDIFVMYVTRDLKGFQAGPYLHFWNAYVK